MAFQFLGQRAFSINGIETIASYGKKNKSRSLSHIIHKNSWWIEELNVKTSKTFKPLKENIGQYLCKSSGIDGFLNQAETLDAVKEKIEGWREGEVGKGG